MVLCSQNDWIRKGVEGIFLGRHKAELMGSPSPEINNPFVNSDTLPLLLLATKKYSFLLQWFILPSLPWHLPSSISPFTFFRCVYKQTAIWVPLKIRTKAKPYCSFKLLTQFTFLSLAKVPNFYFIFVILLFAFSPSALVWICCPKVHWWKH